MNQRLTVLRKCLSQPNVTQEGEVKRRIVEANRLHISRWQKLRKKGIPQVRTSHKAHVK